MAKTQVTTNDALTQKLWDEKMFRDTKKESYFDRFMGDGPNNIVHVKTDLESKKGDRITFGIRMRLSGAGVDEGETLEGNEEALSTFDHTITLTQKRHGVRDAGALDRQRPIYNMDMEAKQALQDWGSEFMDQAMFTAIEASPTKIFYGGSASTTATLTAADLITPTLISKIRVWALTGGNRAQTPLRPVTINGKKYFILLVHPDVAFDLKNDSTYAQARREALDRSSDHPIFTGAIGMWDGVVVHEHENVSLTTDWGAGSNVTGAKCSFMGAQSLLWAWGERPKVVAKEFDYGNEHGYGWGLLYQTNKPVFNSLDYGSIAMYVARTQISDV